MRCLWRNPRKSEFYRYRDLGDNLLSEITKKSIWASHPKDFNDPFDTPFRFDSTALVNFKKWLEKNPCLLSKSPLQRLRIFGHPGRKFILSEFLENIRTIKAMDDEGFVALVDKFDSPHKKNLIEFLKKYLSLGIVCFSKSPDQPVMWAHYASSGAGVCLGYEVEPDLSKVTYKDEPKILNLSEKMSKQEIDTSIQSLASTKLSAWAYEQEFRYVLNENRKLVNFGQTLKTIIFGVKVSDENKTLIKEAVNSVGIDVEYFQVVSNVVRTKLHIVPEAPN